MHIEEYTAYQESEVLALYGSVGWTAYTEQPEALRRGFAGSLLTLASRENGTLVGLLRAVGDNATLVTTLAKDRGTVKILGLVISNALVAFGGCIVCHETRSFSATMGTGQLVYGLAAVIIGVSIIHFYTGTRLARGLRKSGPLRFLGSPQGTTAVVLGSVLYKLCIQVAMSLGLPTNMMKLITAALFLLVLVLSGRKGEAIIHA